MSQLTQKTLNIPKEGFSTGTILSRMTPTPSWQFSPALKQVTTRTQPGLPSQRRMKDLRAFLISSMAPVPFSQCIWKWRRKKTRKWPKTGKRTLMGSSSLCVIAIVPSNLCQLIISMAIDRFILRCRCILDLTVYPRHSTEPTGHHQLLPRKYLSGYHQPKCR
jgi:hypothetical protein